MPVKVVKRGRLYIVQNCETGKTEARSQTKRGASINASIRNKRFTSAQIKNACSNVEKATKGTRRRR